MSTAEEIFTCRQCGHCCEGKGGIVLSAKDLARLCSFLKMQPQELIDKYGEYSGGKLKLSIGPDGNCIFFSRLSSCTIHEAKPDICRAWPYFRGNLLDPVSLAMAKDFCPGINKSVSFEDFVCAGIRALEKENLGAADSSKEANALILPQFEKKH